MTEVAKAAGVSQTLVSKVLCGGSSSIRVGKKTAEKIQNVANKLGFRANSAARAIRSGKFNALALLQSTAGPLSMLPPTLLDGIHDGVAKYGQHLIISRLPDEKLASDGFIPKILSEFYADGLLVNYNAAIPEQMIKLINQHQVPTVWINSKQEQNAVYPDDFDGAYTATKYLRDLGHEKIIYTSFCPPVHYSTFDRKAGYEKAMAEAGLEAFAFSEEVFSKDSGQKMIELLKRDKRPTAVITYTRKAFNAVIFAANQLGLKMPDDLSVITFSPDQIGFVELATTTVILPERQIGEKAVDMLLGRIDDPGKNFEPMPVKCHLKVGNTTGKLADVACPE